MNLERQLQMVEPVADAPQLELKVAFASSDCEHVDQHFGSARGLVVCAVSESQTRLITAGEFGAEKQDGNEAKLQSKLAWLKGCDVLYCAAIGSSAVAQLMAQGVHPVRVQGSPTIDSLAQSLQEELKTGPSTWLARVVKKKLPANTSKFEAMAEEAWEE